jgi:hypothetical protein
MRNQASQGYPKVAGKFQETAAQISLVRRFRRAEIPALASPVESTGIATGILPT